jgi:hypothetical protein
MKNEPVVDERNILLLTMKKLKNMKKEEKFIVLMIQLKRELK